MGTAVNAYMTRVEAILAIIGASFLPSSSNSAAKRKRHCCRQRLESLMIYSLHRGSFGSF